MLMNDKKKIVIYSILAFTFMCICVFLMYLKECFKDIEGILLFTSFIFFILAMSFGATAMIKHWILFWNEIKK